MKLLCSQHASLSWHINVYHQPGNLPEPQILQFHYGVTLGFCGWSFWHNQLLNTQVWCKGPRNNQDTHITWEISQDSGSQSQPNSLLHIRGLSPHFCPNYFSDSSKSKVVFNIFKKSSSFLRNLG